MANEFARNIQDAAINPVAFALPSSASSSTASTSIDLGALTVAPENVELELSVPALSTTIAPDTRTVTYLIESSTTTIFTAVDQTILTSTGTGAGGVGIGAFLKRVRLPSNCARYLRFKITFGGSTTDGSALNATGTVRF